MRLLRNCGPSRGRRQLRSALMALAVGVGHSGTACGIITYGNPNDYVPEPGQFSGVAKLRLHRFDGDTQLCSGALGQPGNIVLTAAHCLTDDARTRAVESVSITFESVSSEILVSTDFVWHQDWTGDPNTSGADLGVIRLPSAPPSGTIAYGVPDFTFGDQSLVEIAGYGDIGQKKVDSSLPAGFLHVGANHYDILPPGPQQDDAYSLFHLYDFDDYGDDKKTDHNQIGEPGWVTIQTPSGEVQAIPMIDFDRDGNSVPAESIIGDGDSGGPTLIDRFFIIGIHSWAANELMGDTILLQGAADAFLGEPGGVAGDVRMADYADWLRDLDFDNLPQPGPGPTPGRPMPAPPLGLLFALGALILCASRRERASR